MLARGRVGETLFGAEQRAVQRSTGAGVVDDVDDSARRSPIMPALCQWAAMLLSDVSVCVGGGGKKQRMWCLIDAADACTSGFHFVGSHAVARGAHSTHVELVIITTKKQRAASRYCRKLTSLLRISKECVARKGW